ncbi:MAG: acylphosphatase [Candidatus Levybacteria bacterium CG10_big_fil_rev_8_21_14_0_10_36_7]|nr:MAG: acylphosphatase [Candidatus Levybacteria bacterium CG10_big_fil_rev_8_21_14_0_10_36_7]
MKQVHLYISGFVQGVGYRRFVKKNADKLNLKGWTRNLPDRRVEVLAQGNKDELEELIKICKKGPFLSEVKDVAVTWEEKNADFNEFQILFK